MSFFVVFVPAVELLVGVGCLGLPGPWGAIALFMVARAVTLVWEFRRPGWVKRRIVVTEASE